MKKINTNSVGRMPLWQSDLDWMQRGYTEPLEAIVQELGMPQEYFPITGCVPYKPDIKTLAMPAGWFWWNGQILPVRALQATDVLSFDNPVVRLTKITYTNPNGSRSFIKPDLSTQLVSNVWQDDYLTPTVVERDADFNSGVRLGIGAWTLRDIIAHRSEDNESDWMNTSGSVQFKRIGRIVMLKGGIFVSSPCTGLPQPVLDPTVVAISDVDKYVSIQGDTLTYHNEDSGLVLPFILYGQTYIAATPYQPTDPNTINDNP